MAESNGFAQVLDQALEDARQVIRQDLRQVREDLGEILSELMQGGLAIAMAGTLAATGLSVMGLVALVEPSQGRARVAYALAGGALATAAGLFAFGVRRLPASPLHELHERLSEDLAKGLPH